MGQASVGGDNKKESELKLKLYSYWRSSCSFRVRIALNLKGTFFLIPLYLLILQSILIFDDDDDDQGWNMSTKQLTWRRESNSAPVRIELVLDDLYFTLLSTIVFIINKSNNNNYVCMYACMV